MSGNSVAARPQAVVLDFGGVLVEIHGIKVLKALNAHAPRADPSALDGISEWQAHHRYERGQMTTAEFCQAVSARLGAPLAEADFVAAWNQIFGPVVAGIEPLLAEISQAVPLYLLSNTNAAHWQHGTKAYPFLAHFRALYTSFDLGVRKPEPAVYQEVARRMAVPEKDVLFVDDAPANVAAARAAGMRSEVCLNSAADLRAIMVAYGVLAAG